MSKPQSDLKPINPTSYYLEGYASTTSIDRDGERMTLGVCKQFHDWFQKGGVTLTKSHEPTSYGVVVDSRLDKKGVWARVLLEDPYVNTDVKRLIHGLEIGETWGFSIRGAKPEHDHIDCIPTITKVLPVNVGLSPDQSNPDCVVRLVKPKSVTFSGVVCPSCRAVMTPTRKAKK